jgi:hypothetical protein
LRIVALIALIVGGLVPLFPHAHHRSRHGFVRGLRQIELREPPVIADGLGFDKQPPRHFSLCDRFKTISAIAVHDYWNGPPLVLEQDYLGG